MRSSRLYADSSIFPYQNEFSIVSLLSSLTPHRKLFTKFLFKLTILNTYPVDSTSNVELHFSSLGIPMDLWTSTLLPQEAQGASQRPQNFLRKLTLMELLNFQCLKIKSKTNSHSKSVEGKLLMAFSMKWHLFSLMQTNFSSHFA